MLILDDATSALDAKTQAHVASAIESEQARLGFTVIQIAHRLETLKASDVIYFFVHGRVVERGGEESLSRAAVDELLKVPVEWRSVEDPESGERKQRLHAGFFHDMWDRAQGVTPPREMPASKLRAKESELRKELCAVGAALKKKDALHCIRMRLRAVALFAQPRK